MESNLQIQNFKQMVTNLLTEMLRALENPEMTNTNERDTRRPMERFFPSQNLGAYWIQMNSMAEFREVQTALHGQAIEMEENGIETEALVFLLLKLTQLAEAVREARDRWLTYRDFSSVDLVQFLLRKILNDPWGPNIVGVLDGVPRMIGLNEEIKTYYSTILNHESVRELLEDASEQVRIFDNWPFTQDDICTRFMAEVGGRLIAILRKFLEVETLLNNQQNVM